MHATQKRLRKVKGEDGREISSSESPPLPRSLFLSPDGGEKVKKSGRKCWREIHSALREANAQCLTTNIYTHTHTHTVVHIQTHTHTHTLSLCHRSLPNTHTHTHTCFFSIVCSAAEAGPERRIYMVSCTRERCKDQIRAEQSRAEQHSAALP